MENNVDTTSVFYQKITSKKLLKWLKECIDLCQPDKVHLCDGYQSEYEQLCLEEAAKGSFIKLNKKLRPNSYLVRSNPADVARVEECTFICSEKESDAGPTNNWFDPERMRIKLQGFFRGCMNGRTMYIIPFCMGPLGSSLSTVGVEISDSAYAVCNMHIMTRMGNAALELINQADNFIPCLHSVGVPLKSNDTDVKWPCCPEKRHIVHFPESQEIWSYGSGYGGNALLGKKCLALRIASATARREGWLAEHMLILGLTNPEGNKKYMAAAFPSACGKTNLSMLQTTVPNWKVECVGDDIAWIKPGPDGRLYAINPEAGFFGVAPGTSIKSNPNAMLSIRGNSIFTNVALTDKGDVWWEGMTEEKPNHLIDWKGKDWYPSSSTLAAHPNARFTAPIEQCPCVDNEFENIAGVPLEAIIFGGRRNSDIPLVREANSWQQGVFMGASISSETTSASSGETGKLRHDPFAMLPFCGYNMGDYFSHWLEIGKGMKKDKLPKIYFVNWFNKDEKGNFIWPGFGENSRILKWIFERSEDKAEALKTAIGLIPKELDLEGLTIKPGNLSRLFQVKKKVWQQELKNLRTYFQTFGDHLPTELLKEIEKIEKQL